MSKNTPIRAIGAKPSKEEMEEQAKRAFIQKRNSIAETILYNSVGRCHSTRTIIQKGEDGIQTQFNQHDFKQIVDAAIEAADYMMEKLYSVAITDKTAE